ncbi:MAG: hypothetical protein QM767_10255 [Anaeromyxobacter sp.]
MPGTGRRRNPDALLAAPELVRGGLPVRVERRAAVQGWAGRGAARPAPPRATRPRLR